MGQRQWLWNFSDFPISFFLFLKPRYMLEPDSLFCVSNKANNTGSCLLTNSTVLLQSLWAYYNLEKCVLCTFLAMEFGRKHNHIVDSFANPDRGCFRSEPRAVIEDWGFCLKHDASGLSPSSSTTDIGSFPDYPHPGVPFLKFQAIKLFLWWTLALEAVIEVENVTVLA